MIIRHLPAIEILVCQFVHFFLDKNWSEVRFLSADYWEGRDNAKNL